MSDRTETDSALSPLSGPEGLKERLDRVAKSIERMLAIYKKTPRLEEDEMQEHHEQRREYENLLRTTHSLIKAYDTFGTEMTDEHINFGKSSDAPEPMRRQLTLENIQALLAALPSLKISEFELLAHDIARFGNALRKPLGIEAAEALNVPPKPLELVEANPTAVRIIQKMRRQFDGIDPADIHIQWPADDLEKLEKCRNFPAANIALKNACADAGFVHHSVIVTDGSRNFDRAIEKFRSLFKEIGYNDPIELEDRMLQFISAVNRAVGQAHSMRDSAIYPFSRN